VLWLLELLANLPSAGNRNNDSASMDYVGSWGIVWASSVDGSNSHNLNWNSDDADWNNDNRAYGFSVRCLRDYAMFCRVR
jgi:hypothetical protein